MLRYSTPMPKRSQGTRCRAIAPGCRQRALIAAVAIHLLACGTEGRYVWVDSYPAAKQGEQTYRISPGDVIAVRVFNQDQMNTRAKVRDDGKISLPLLNDVVAAGLSPPALAAALQEALVAFIKNPLVTVALEEAHPATVVVAGQVAHPGTLPLVPGDGVLQVLAKSGGLTPDADDERIFVLRKSGGGYDRIRFRYRSLIRSEGAALTFRLMPGDVVTVE